MWSGNAGCYDVKIGLTRDLFAGDVPVDAGFVVWQQRTWSIHGAEKSIFLYRPELKISFWSQSLELKSRPTTILRPAPTRTTWSTSPTAIGWLVAPQLGHGSSTSCNKVAFLLRLSTEWWILVQVTMVGSWTVCDEIENMSEIICNFLLKIESDRCWCGLAMQGVMM